MHYSRPVVDAKLPGIWLTDKLGKTSTTVRLYDERYLLVITQIGDQRQLVGTDLHRLNRKPVVMTGSSLGMLTALVLIELTKVSLAVLRKAA